MTKLLVLSGFAAVLISAAPAAEDWPILTPKPGAAPHINGPAAYGARPAHPFLCRIRCTGQRPIRFSVTNLPQGLTLEPTSGIIRGTTPSAAGDYRVTITARN